MLRSFVCIRCLRPTARHHTSHSGMCAPCKLEHDKEGDRATADVTNAIKRGHMKRASEYVCVDCGTQARDWDHRDYAKPMDVEPVCRSCNLKRGIAYDSVYRPVGAPPVVPFVRIDYRALRFKQLAATG
jgi:DNA-directed RNA polymerase subunit RPC12/RpoP